MDLDEIVMPPVPPVPLVEPRLPDSHLREIARHLDREAGFALNRGERLFAERASHRAEQLRAAAGAVR